MKTVSYWDGDGIGDGYGYTRYVYRQGIPDEFFPDKDRTVAWINLQDGTMLKPNDIVWVELKPALGPNAPPPWYYEVIKPTKNPKALPRSFNELASSIWQFLIG
jgi:hypothetical protein